MHLAEEFVSGKAPNAELKTHVLILIPNAFWKIRLVLYSSRILPTQAAEWLVSEVDIPGLDAVVFMYFAQILIDSMRSFIEVTTVSKFLGTPPHLPPKTYCWQRLKKIPENSREHYYGQLWWHPPSLCSGLQGFCCYWSHSSKWKTCPTRRQPY